MGLQVILRGAILFQIKVLREAYVIQIFRVRAGQRLLEGASDQPAAKEGTPAREAQPCKKCLRGWCQTYYKMQSCISKRCGAHVVHIYEESQIKTDRYLQYLKVPGHQRTS